MVLQLAPFLLVLAGASAVAFAFAADMLGATELPGIGPRQITLALAGSSLLFTGAMLLLPPARRYLGEWLLLCSAIGAVTMGANFIAIRTNTGEPIEKVVMLAAVAFGAWVIAFGSATAPAPWHAEILTRTAAFVRAESGRLASVVGQLLLLVLVIRQYTLENETFTYNMMWLTLYGFVIHALLPLRYRLTFFVLLSLTAIAGVFGLVNGSWLVALGLGLIVLCRLPVAFGWRVGLVAAAGASLALLRTEWASQWMAIPWSLAIWPILGSMFMFRLIVYLYDLKHQKEPTSITQTLAYFFLLPNIVFPLFPVVDFATFRRTYYNDDHYRIYQTGLNWMVRGVIHLVLYRFVSYYLLIGPEDVTNSAELVRYLVTNFLLYLRVSGQFHLIIGILHLFGFNLPETHHLYYLASSFTDFWRRINIYWKDFMLKVFYYPAYFRLRQLGATAGLVLATFFVFIATWFLHGYQWFWLRGSFLFTWQDILFWLILAVLVVINSLYEVRRGRKRALGARSWTWRELALLSLRTAGTFLALCVLWSLWTSTSLLDWLSLWAVLDFSWQGLGSLVAVLGVVAVTAALLHVRKTVGAGIQTHVNQPNFYRSAMVTTATLVCLYLLSDPVVIAQTEGKARQILNDLKVARLNDQDADLLERGYYEDLIGINRFNSQLWEIYSKSAQLPPNIWTTAAGRASDDFLAHVLVPSTSIRFYDQPFTTNRWAMRDQEYERQKAAGVYRSAFLGSSHLMGWGVADQDTFEWLLEDRLNRENDGRVYSEYESLNFGAAGYTALQSLLVLKEKVIAFEPDTVFYVAHPGEAERLVDQIIGRLQAGVEIPFNFVNDIVQNAGIDERTYSASAQRRLTPFGNELVSWSYQQIVDTCRQRGILPVWILLPRDRTFDPEEVASLVAMANQAGFIVINLVDLYEGMSVEAIWSLWVSDVDYHPNAKGHQLIADRLYQSLTLERESLGLRIGMK
jgi:hypothetical protein